MSDEGMTLSEEVRATLRSWPGHAEQAEHRQLLEALEDTAFSWREFPARVKAAFSARGWAWNGIYLRDGDDHLRLVAAAGPPVCEALPRSGGVGSSGMCWDGLALGRTLCTNDVKAWPGYVSCDGESGLATVAGLVVPLRDATLRPIGVWDLDALEALRPSDPIFLDALLSGLARRHPLVHADFSL